MKEDTPPVYEKKYKESGDSGEELTGNAKL